MVLFLCFEFCCFSREYFACLDLTYLLTLKLSFFCDLEKKRNLRCFVIRSPSPYNSSGDERLHSHRSNSREFERMSDSGSGSPQMSPEMGPTSAPLGPDGKPDWRSLRTSGPYANTNQSSNNRDMMIHQQHRVLRSASRSASRLRGEGSGHRKTGSHSMRDGDGIDVLEVDDESEYVNGRETHRSHLNSRSSSDLSRSSSDQSISEDLSGSDAHDGSEATDDDDDDDDLFASTLGSDFLDLFARDGLIGCDDSESDDAPSPLHTDEGKNSKERARCSPIRIGSSCGDRGNDSNGSTVNVQFSLGSARSNIAGPATTVMGVSNMSLTPRPASVGPPSVSPGLGRTTLTSGRRATTAAAFD